jgi:hypothetical protein
LKKYIFQIGSTNEGRLGVVNRFFSIARPKTGCTFFLQMGADRLTAAICRAAPNDRRFAGRGAPMIEQAARHG